MQDLQSYEDDAGNVYVREGNRWRVTRPSQAAAPAGPQAIPGLVSMETPQLRAQREQQDRQYGLSSQREERMARAAEDTARQAEITASRLSPAEEDQLKVARAAAREALGVLPDLERFQGLNRDQASGGLFAVPFADAVVGAFDRDVSQMNEITSRLAPAQREEGSGPMSDADLMLYLRSVPSVQRPREANDAIIERGRREAARRRAYADFLDQFAAQNNTLKGADAAFRAAVDAGEIDLGAVAAPAATDAPAGPGSSPDAPFDFTTASREEVVAAIQRGGWFRQGPDGEPYQLPPGDPQFGMQEGDEAVAPGVAVRPQGGGSAAAEQVLGGAAAFQRSALEQFPLGDEAVAGLAGLFSGQGYSRAREAQRALASYDRQNNGVERNMGGIGGGLALAATPFGAPVRAFSGAGRVASAGNAALGGSAAGGAWGFGQGEGNALERLPEAGTGALVGGVAGPIAAPTANALNRGVIQPLAGLARGGYNALRGRPADPLVSGINRFADRSPQQVNALNSEAARFQAEGIAPTLVDAVNDGGRGTLRSLATRQTPARQAARDFADGRVEALPGRISRQARRIVSDDARPVEDIVGGLRLIRAAQARTTYAEPYAQTVPIDETTTQALSGAPGRAALQRARAAAEAFNDAPAMQEIDALAAGEVAEVSAATLDRIRQAMSGRAERLAQNPATRAVGAGVAQRAGMVDGALDNVEGLAPARDAYRQASRQIEATQMGGRFMNANPDEFAGAMRGLSPDQLQPARAATARSIEIAARNPGSAPGVARRLYADPETANMGRAVMGDDMDRLSQAARVEAGAVRNAIEVNPRAGSPTSMNAQDSLGAAGAVLGVARDATNPIALAGRAISAIRNRGFSDTEAEAIVTAAIDPAQTERLIGMLAERMTRREARSLARAVRYQLTTGPQSALQQ